MAHDELEPSPYYLDAYLVPSVGRQLREYLGRQRSQGVESFDLAWRQARRKLKHAHEWSERVEEKEMLADPVLKEAWRCAYERRPHPMLDAIRTMTSLIEEADGVDAPRRHESRRLVTKVVYRSASDA